jgi:ATP-dependent 26S proteasome regulatory subunit
MKHNLLNRFRHEESGPTSGQASQKGTRPALNYAWVREILLKRAANHSTVACVATSDPVRVLQIKAYLAECRDFASSEVYLFEPWRGLEQLKRSGNEHLYFEPVRPNAGEYAQMAGVQNAVLDLNQALRHMDKILQSKRSLFILEYMDSPNEQQKEHQLVYALRSWAHDPEIRYQGSLIVLIVASVSRVLDELTKEYAILQQPPISSYEERLKTIDDLASKLGIALKRTRERLAQATAGLNIHQLESVLLETHQRHRGFPLEFVKELKSDYIKKSGLLEVTEHAADGFASIGGYQKIKDFVIENIVGVLQESERANHLVLTLPRGFVLFGPPGTGKSLFARALAAEINLPIINFRTENLFSKYLGESGHNFRDAIRLAEQMSPAILFIDEIDKLLRRRSGETSDGASNETRGVLNLVLEWLGDKSRQSILVGATNRPEDLDEAAIRPGRIDYMIPMLYPDAEARRQILMVHLGLQGGQPVPLSLSSEESGKLLAFLAKETEDFSGAELEHLVNKAKRLAFTARADALAAEHFYEALERTNIDHDQRRREVEHFSRIAKKHARDTDLL